LQRRKRYGLVKIMKQCSICGQDFSAETSSTIFTEAGEWLAEELWRDKGELCPQCLENRAQLAMMYCHDINT
jgi:hypothetical protein